jgi:hypothetical protein
MLAVSLLLAAPACLAQTVSISTPASGATINGLASPLAATLTSIPNAASIEWDIDGERLVVDYECFGSVCAPYSYNTADFGNGQHNIYAIVRDGLNNCLAVTSGTCSSPGPGQPLTINNSLPCNDGGGSFDEQITVTPSTSVTSSWSGAQTITVSSTGTQCASNGGWTWYLAIDGKQAAALTGTSSGGTLTFQTQNFYNGARKVSVVAYQSVESSSQLMGSWQYFVTFANTGSNLVPVEMNASAREVFLTPGGSAANCGGGVSCTLTGTEFKSDSSTTSRTPGCGLLTNPDGTSTAPVTVSGNCTLTAGSSYGAGLAVAVDPYASVTATYYSNSGGQAFLNLTGITVAPYMVGWWVKITGGGSGWNAGTVCYVGGVFSNYQLILSANGSGGTGNGNCNPGTVGSTGGTVSLGPGREFFITVNSQNTVPHFARNGGILTTFSPTASLIPLALFNSGNEGDFSYANWINDYLAGGWNTVEENLGCSVAGNGAGENMQINPSASGLWSFNTCSGAGTQSQWQSNFSSSVASYVSLAESKGFYMGFTATNWTALAVTSGDLGIFDMTQGVGSAYSSGPVWTQALNFWNGRGNSCTPTSTQPCYGSAVRLDTNDEVNSSYGGLPLPGATFGSAVNCGTVGGTCGPVQIVSNGTTCTVTFPNYSVNGGQKIIISGATTSGFNSVYPNVYPVTLSPTTFSFPCTVASGTYNSTTDPTLAVQIFPSAWSTSTAFVTDNALAVLMSQYPKVSGQFSPPVTWPAVGISSYSSLQNWLADARMSSYASLYVDYTSVAKIGVRTSHLFGYGNYSQAAQLYGKLPYAPRDQSPWCGEGQAASGDYAQTGAINRNFQTGAAISLSSFTGDTITMSADHGFRNVLSGATRLKLSNMSNSADNGIYYVRSFPTSTTIQVVWCGKDCSTGNPPTTSSGTLTFDNGDIETSAAWHIEVYGGQQFLQFNGACKSSDIGHTFTVSGSGSSFWNSATGYYGLGSDATCFSNSNNSQIFSVPTGSSTSGTVEIIEDNNFHLGINVAGNAFGPAYNVLESITPMMLGSGASCMRDYLSGAGPQNIDPITGVPNAISRTRLFDNYSELNEFEYEVGAWTAQDMQGSRSAWWAEAPRNFLFQRFAKLLLQPHFGSPDYGDGFLAIARGDGGFTYGNGLLIQSFWDVTKTVTVNLAPYLISGQAIWKYYSTPLTGWTITPIAAGTATDTLTCEAICTAFYAFSTAGTAEVQEPTFGARLADVTNATQVAARYACTPWPLGQPLSPVLLPAASLSSGTATMPIDVQMCPNSYQILYLNSAGTILATGAVTPANAWQP